MAIAKLGGTYRPCELMNVRINDHQVAACCRLRFGIKCRVAKGFIVGAVVSTAHSHSKSSIALRHIL
jgi:hypothetical protein